MRLHRPRRPRWLSALAPAANRNRPGLPTLGWTIFARGCHCWRVLGRGVKSFVFQCNFLNRAGEFERRLVVEGDRLAAVLADAEGIDAKAAGYRLFDMANRNLFLIH